jgi:hypothetical protein
MDAPTSTPVTCRRPIGFEARLASETDRATSEGQG